MKNKLSSWLLNIKILCCILVLSGSVAAQAPSAYAGGDCTSINGMYVAVGYGTTGILGNTTKENALLNFARNNGVNYLILYNLEGMDVTSTRASQLASLISRARADYGIHQIGAALGAAESADMVIAYNNAHAANERIDVLNLEYEFWNETNRAAAFNNAISILNYFNTLGATHNLESEIYIGWITEAEGVALGNTADRILVHFYRKTDADIINYGIERLQYLAGASRNVRIAPIFSNEGPANTGDPTSYFMGPWLETHPNDQAYKTWINGYNALSATWKNNLDVMGPTWFLYNHFADINVGKPNHITANPVSQQACISDSVTLSVASSASAKNYCWMKDGVCLSDNAHVSGSKTASLTLTSLRNQDYGDYAARVISYDTNNPTSFTSAIATVSPAASCGGTSTQNLALNKPVTASSFIAAGYEPYRIVDGNTTSSRWASAYSGNQWIQVDLGASYNINRVKLTWEAAYAIAYQIQVSSNGSSWTTLRSVTGNSALVNDQTGLSGTGRYVRIYGTQKALPQWGFSLFELEAFGNLSAQ